MIYLLTMINSNYEDKLLLQTRLNKYLNVKEKV